MSRGMPSMTALLGLLALAGYQNRDKLAEMLKGANNGQPGASNQQGPLGGLLGNIGGALAGGGVGGAIERRARQNCSTASSRTARGTLQSPG